MTRKLLVASALVLAGLATGLSASAENKAQRYEVLTPFSSIKAGAARVDVKAPIDVVRKVVTDYGSYSEHIKRFEKARIVGKHGDKTDVYLQVPIMKGAAKVWAVVRFEPAKQMESGEEVIVGKMIQGNVKRLDATWKLSKVDDANTKLNLELLIVPDIGIPVPGSLVTGEVAFAAEKAVRGMRNRSETLNAH
jgi:ribosome-associated toxin RatA of RatAB toxin-antitoxin module